MSEPIVIVPGGSKGKPRPDVQYLPLQHALCRLNFNAKDTYDTKSIEYFILSNINEKDKYLLSWLSTGCVLMTDPGFTKGVVPGTGSKFICYLPMDLAVSLVTSLYNEIKQYSTYIINESVTVDESHLAKRREQDTATIARAAGFVYAGFVVIRSLMETQKKEKITPDTSMLNLHSMMLNLRDYDIFTTFGLPRKHLIDHYQQCSVRNLIRFGEISNYANGIPPEPTAYRPVLVQVFGTRKTARLEGCGQLKISCASGSYGGSGVAMVNTDVLFPGDVAPPDFTSFNATRDEIIDIAFSPEKVIRMTQKRLPAQKATTSSDGAAQTKKSQVPKPNTQTDSVADRKKNKKAANKQKSSEGVKSSNDGSESKVQSKKDKKTEPVKESHDSSSEDMGDDKSDEDCGDEH
ncbi:hypothetical protein [Inachis io cypovirus 2]|uniref:VP9 n=1 Tax=Inachis io cypovirus 2 TaxID=1382295 RepID=W6EKD9_9REOV|nr:hypothetical protein [Inachis io cypovirus 2]AHJ14799.1 hypothetical protein [Inachis io cypovirus 2]